MFRDWTLVLAIIGCSVIVYTATVYPAGYDTDDGVACSSSGTCAAWDYERVVFCTGDACTDINRYTRIEDGMYTPPSQQPDPADCDADICINWNPVTSKPVRCSGGVNPFTERKCWWEQHTNSSELIEHDTPGEVYWTRTELETEPDMEDYIDIAG